MSKERTSSLNRDPLRSVLDRLHQEAHGDRKRFVSIVPRVLWGWVRGKTFAQTVTPKMMKECFLPVSRNEGEFLYLMTRSTGARQVVEFGTSFAISTIYLAAGVRDNGGGAVIGTELEPSKHERATAHLKDAAVDDIAEVRLGDALETLKDLNEPVDLVFLDGWKDLYLPVIELLTPRLRTGAVVLADNIYTFKKALRPYVEYMQSGEHGFESTTLPVSDGVEFSYYVG